MAHFVFMVKSPYSWPFAMIGVLLLFVQPVSGDTILLKDGTTIESQRVWTSDGFVHFILKGTRDVEIRYASEIVDKINGIPVGAKSVKPASLKPSGPDMAAAGTKNTKQAFANSTSIQDWKMADDLEVDAFIRSNKGVLFYDPHRSKRYRSDFQTGFTTLDAALADLAGRYGKPVQWIESHMGEENDLGRIHYNLNLALSSDAETGKATLSIKKVGRADHEDSGTSRVNDVNATGSGPAMTAPRQIDVPEDYQGILFYDPRRQQKFWATPESKHQTLRQAIASLAQQYGATPHWIEENMGGSNKLEEIHRSIRSRLAGN